MVVHELTPPVNTKLYPITEDQNQNYLSFCFNKLRQQEDNSKKTVAKTLQRQVRFADSFGLQLATVRIMSEDSNAPPKINPAAIRRSTSASANQGSPPLSPTFEQPISNFSTFIQRLNQQSVTLESVHICGESLQGIIKVQNLAYRKQVSIQYTTDRWQTSRVHDGCYMKVNALPAASRYDSFSFSIVLPADTQNIEFCVKYDCMGNTYWDNNRGSNYILCSETG